MGGDDSQKLLPWRGIYSSPGRKPPAHYEINTVTETPPTFCAGCQRDCASATDCLGHFWQAQVGHFRRAPKDYGRKRAAQAAQSNALRSP